MRTDQLKTKDDEKFHEYDENVINRQVRVAFKDKKYLPLDIRTKKTRALRRKLTTKQVLLCS